MHMYSRLVTVDRAAADRLMVRDGPSRGYGNHAAQVPEGRRVDAGLALQGQMNGHHDLFERGIARPFAQAANGDIHAAGPRRHRGQRIGRRHAEVIVTMETERQAGDTRPEPGEDGTDLHRVPDPDRVGQAQPAGASQPGGQGQVFEEIRIRPRCVLSAHEDEIKPVASRGDELANLLDDRAGWPADDSLMDGRGGETEVDRRNFRPGCGLDVLVASPGPGGQSAGKVEPRQVANDLSFFFAHGRDADLELGYAGPGQRRGDLQLLPMAEGHARGLLTVTQRGVDDPDWSVFATLQRARHLTREIVTHRWGTPRCTLHTPGSDRRRSRS